MRCPSRVRLARAALGPDDEGLTAHIEACPRCRAEWVAIRSLMQRLAEGHAALDSGHEEAREALLALLPAENSRPKPAWSWDLFFNWMGGSTMGRRVVFGGVGAVCALTLAMLWLGLSAGRASAMNVVAEAVRKAKSYQFTISYDPPENGEALAPSVVPSSTRYSWLAPGSYRIETKEGPPAIGQTTILPDKRPGIRLDHTKKTFEQRPARLGQISPLMLLDNLGSYAGSADRDLGRKEIDGKPAKGFIVEAKKIDPDAQPGTMEIWVDAGSNLPIIILYRMRSPAVPLVIRMDGFRWDVELAPELFDPTPPEGYTEVKPSASDLDRKIAQIAEGLKLFAKYNGGRYPQVKTIYGDVLKDELDRLSAPNPPPKEEDVRAEGERIGMLNRAVWGFSHMTVIQRDNSDAAYHGKAVGPDDKDKVLFRWKLEDGRYQVLFGDLRSEAVTPARLRSLEGN